jgi:hypothetical protein
MGSKSGGSVYVQALLARRMMIERQVGSDVKLLPLVKSAPFQPGR